MKQPNFLWILFVLFCSTNTFAIRQMTVSERINSELNLDIQSNQSKPFIQLPGESLTFSETLPEEQLTVDALNALEQAPDWLKKDLRDNFEQLDPDFQNIYAELILNPDDTRFTDEIAFCVANIQPEILQHENFIPSVIEENAMYVYEHDQYLDYVRIVDIGEPGDPNYFSTTSYKVLEDGVVSEYELDREKYYWYIVHPKIEDEMVLYCDPDSQGAPPAEPPTGVFWRNWVFTFTEEIFTQSASSREMYPILKDHMNGINVLWKSEVNQSDNGAVGAITEWIKSVLEFGSGAERPIQPVRVYKLHLGRCGEHQDLTTAAARACLIPCLNTQAYGEDHVWNEFWDRRFIHWEPVNTMIDDPLQYENGWGKVFSGVVNVTGDGYTWDVIDQYSDGFCTIDIRVQDSQGDPVDGAKVFLKRTDKFTSTWAFTGSDGTAHLKYGEDRSCLCRVISTLGKVPSDTFHTIAESTVDGQNYSWTATYESSLPEIPVSPVEKSLSSTGYRLDIDYEVVEEVLWGYYQYDGGKFFSRRIPGGSIDFFIVDDENRALYEENESFNAFEIAMFQTANSIKFHIPDRNTDYTFVLSAERKLKCKQIVNVTASLKMGSDENWVEIEKISRQVEIPPGQVYAASISLPTELGVHLFMPSNFFQPGDICWLKVALDNPGNILADVPFFVVLDAYGSYFFWPEWKGLPDISYQEVDLLNGVSIMDILPPFEWPENVGTADGLFFYGVMTNSDITSLFGGMDTEEFGWGD